MSNGKVTCKSSSLTNIMFTKFGNEKHLHQWRSQTSQNPSNSMEMQQNLTTIIEKLTSYLLVVHCDTDCLEKLIHSAKQKGLCHFSLKTGHAYFNHPMITFQSQKPLFDSLILEAIHSACPRSFVKQQYWIFHCLSCRLVSAPQV